MCKLPLRERNAKRSFARAAARAFACVLAAALFAAPLPARAAAAPEGVRVADPDTRDGYQASLGAADSTLQDGRVWVDKTVSTTGMTFAGDVGTIEIDNDSDFLIAYSALATSTQLISATRAPVDVVFVLDFSASMAWGQYENGQGTVTDQAGSRVQAMVDAVNQAIDTLANASPENRVGIVVFNRGAQDMLDLQSVAPRADKQYLVISHWAATPGADDGNNGNVQVTCQVGLDRTIPLDSYTNIHAGLYGGFEMLAATASTTVELEGQTFTRIPNLILMSDGAPTTFSAAASGGEWWNGLTNTPIGSGDNNTPHSGNGFMPLVTAAYMKNRVSAHYYPDGSGAARAYTIGFMTADQNEGMRTMADLVLEPGAYWDRQNQFAPTSIPAVDAVNTAWQQYRAGTPPAVQYTRSGRVEDYTVDIAPPPYAPASLNYPDAYYPADNADDLWDAFQQIISTITNTAQGPTKVEGDDPVHSGYLTYTDPIGDYMQVERVKSILWAGIQFDLEADFVPAAVPQPGGGTLQTYTGHFATAGGGKTFDSPVYGRGNIDDILVTVSADASGRQTLQVAVPAAAIPIRVNTVTLDVDGVPTDNTTNNAYPLRVLYTVGLQDGVLRADGTLNTDPAQGGVSAEYLAAHTENGQVYFYSNLYEDDREGTVTVGSSNAAFTSADTNPFYFLQQDLPVYLDRACTRRADAAVFDPGRSYYIQQSYYAGAGSAVTARTYVYERSGESMAPYVTRTAEGWSIRRGAPRLGNLSDLIRLKTADPTATAAAAFYPTFRGQDVYDGRFVSYLGNNGRLALRAPAALTIAKRVEAAPGLTAPQQAEFAFTLSIPAKAGQTVPVQRRAADGATAAESLTFSPAGEAAFTLRAGEALTVPDVQGLAYSVTEPAAALPLGFTLTGAAAEPAGGTFTAADARFSGAMGSDPVTVTFTNTYTAAFDPAGARIELPVAKELTGDRTGWAEGESYTFRIAPAPGTNPNAARLPVQDTLTLSAARPAGAFTLDLSRLLDTARTQAAASHAATPESAQPEPQAQQPGGSAGAPAAPATPESATAETARARRQPQPAADGAITGVYAYRITEQSGTGAPAGDTVTLDATVYEAQITVTDDGAGGLAAELTAFTRLRDAQGNALTPPQDAVQALFVNTVASAPAPTPSPRPTATPQPTAAPAPSAAPVPTATAAPTPAPTPARPATPAPTARPGAGVDAGGAPTAAPAASPAPTPAPAVPQTADAFPLTLLGAGAALGALGLALLRKHRR